MRSISNNLYSIDSIAQIERDVIENHGVSGYTLMRRAGRAVLDTLCEKAISSKSILVVCGVGNNAGDGYVVARLAQQIAQQKNWEVKLVSLIDPKQLQGDALQAYQHWAELGEVLEPNFEILDDADVIVDAILGTGVSRDVSGQWLDWVDAISQSNAYVISVDVPSGLNANTGQPMGSAVRADTTVTFIGLKKGLFTASGKTCCGELSFNQLSLPETVFEDITVDAILTNTNTCHLLPPRMHDSHKGHNGHIVAVGGNHGMPGSIALVAKAALKTGAGLVSVVTRKNHIAAVTAACPEAMVYASYNGEYPEGLIDKASIVVIGPGLGQDAWSQRLFHQAVLSKKTLLIDADALKLFADMQLKIKSPCIITPHPGEAAYLLSSDTNSVQKNRFESATKLVKKVGATVVLKGSGTIICDGDEAYVCPYGNPAMATAGMGDALAGIIAASYSQGLSLNDSAVTGTYYHAMAGDLAAKNNTRGLLASELIEVIPQVVNQGVL